MWNVELLAQRPEAIIQGQAQLEFPIILSASQRPLSVIQVDFGSSAQCALCPS
jgi:hypothetical protein